MQNRRLTKIFLAATVLLGIIAPIVSIVGFGRIEDRVMLLDKHLWDNHSDVMQSTVTGDYPLSSFIKDTIVNAALYKNIIMILLIVTLIFLGFLAANKPKKEQVQRGKYV